MIAVAVFGPPCVLAATALSGRNVIGQGGRLGYAAAVALVTPGILRALRNPAHAPLAAATTVLFIAMLAQPLTLLFAGHVGVAARGMREVLYAALWCGSFWLAYVTARSPERIRYVSHRIDRLGTLIAVLVYAALAANAVGVNIGEVIDSPGEVRYFGALGDATPFLLLFFIFREIIRGNWLRLALFVAPFLAGVSRGATLAFVVGFAYLVAGDLLYALRRASARRVVKVLAAVVVISATFFGLLRFTDAGEKLVRRFESVVAVGGTAALGDRLPSMRRAWGVFLAHPWLGIGPAGYRQYVADLGLAYQPPESRRRPDQARPGGPVAVEIASAQNQALQLAAESGLVGLLAYAAFCLVALRTVRRARSTGDRETTAFFRAVEVFTVAVIFGVQTTVWILDKASLGFLTFLLLGVAARKAALPSLRARPLRVQTRDGATASR